MVYSIQPFSSKYCYDQAGDCTGVQQPLREELAMAQTCVSWSGATTRRDLALSDRVSRDRTGTRQDA